MISSICVFCASSQAIRPEYFDAARGLGHLLGERRLRMVFGGGTAGLMGEAARAVHAAGGTVTGVIPEALNREGVTYEVCDELVITPGMRERKAEMERRADAFVALPGGFGTLEEILEHITLRQLRYHPKPVVLVNTLDFYAPLIRLFDHLIEERFARDDHRRLYHVAATPGEAMEYLDAYRPAELRDKWSG